MSVIEIWDGLPMGMSLATASDDGDDDDDVS
jgi:hypothetical protein